MPNAFEQLIQRLTDEIGAFFASPAVQLVILAIFWYLFALWAATAYWAYRDLQQRTSNPIAPYLAAVLIILFTPFFFVFGYIIYRIIRPSETVAEANERALAEEAMMVEIESQPHCANCSRQVHEDWIICPTCRNRLRRVCPNCSRLVELDWSLCAWCGKDFERPDLLHEVTVPPPVGRPISPGDSGPALPSDTEQSEVPAIDAGGLQPRTSGAGRAQAAPGDH
ncbi:MAG TPA: zinc ribbon domain-containing protein [Candidatus Limnocylindrales bacterium]|nr:zinc ribbon domain-containing protein [Candidatus Limnocylindrales bacterium]